MSVQNKLHTAWAGIRAAFAKMEPMSQVRPTDAASVFSADEGAAEPKFTVQPIVFRVPERANVRTPNLFIVLSGWLTFAPPLPADGRQTTLEFATRVGYFRSKNGELSHVYGAHYDMDEDLPGHPVFHAQVGSQAELVPAISERFREPFDEGRDFADGILRNVRTPSAQMDVFSVITQIGADHLISTASGPEVLAAFGKLREACNFFVGAAGRIAYLNCAAAARCYRSTHWYGRGGQAESQSST